MVLKNAIPTTLIGVALLGFGIVSLTGRRRPSGKPESVPKWYVDATVGDRLCAPPDNRQTFAGRRLLVIAASATCPICASSSVFHQQLERAAREVGIAVLYTYGEGVLDRKQVEILRAQGRTALQVAPHSLGITRVPSYLLLVDGVISSEYVGGVAEKESEHVIAELLAANSRPPYRTLPPDQLVTQLERSQYTLVSLSVANPEEVTIPAEQFDVRGKYEIPRDRAAVIDCATAKSLYSCQNAALTLWSSGHQGVIALGLPHRACP